MPLSGCWKWAEWGAQRGLYRRGRRIHIQEGAWLWAAEWLRCAVLSRLLESSLVGRVQTVWNFSSSHLVVNDEERDILEAWHIYWVCSFETMGLPYPYPEPQGGLNDRKERERWENSSSFHIPAGRCETIRPPILGLCLFVSVMWIIIPTSQQGSGIKDERYKSRASGRSADKGSYYCTFPGPKGGSCSAPHFLAEMSVCVRLLRSSSA